MTNGLSGILIQLPMILVQILLKFIIGCKGLLFLIRAFTSLYCNSILLCIRILLILINIMLLRAILCRHIEIFIGCTIFLKLQIMILKELLIFVLCSKLFCLFLTVLVSIFHGILCKCRRFLFCYMTAFIL